MAENWICRPIIVVTWWPLNACYAESSESNYFSSGHELPIFASSSPLEIATYSSVFQAIFFKPNLFESTYPAFQRVAFSQKSFQKSGHVLFQVYYLCTDLHYICDMWVVTGKKWTLLSRKQRWISVCEGDWHHFHVMMFPRFVIALLRPMVLFPH